MEYGDLSPHSKGRLDFFRILTVIPRGPLPHMPFRALFLLAVVTALPAFAADTPDAVIVAAMRLSDEPNYRWVTTVVDDARTYEIHGATVKGGYTHVKMPMVNKVRRRLGRSATDTDIEAFFKGNVRCVLETEDGWKTVAELPPPLEPSSVDPAPVGGLLGLPPPKPKLSIVRTVRGSGAAPA